MSFKIEKIFGLLSLAAMGFLAISCVPNVKEASVMNTTVELPIELEVDAVRQVELMNAQTRPTFHAGESSSQN